MGLLWKNIPIIVAVIDVVTRNNKIENLLTVCYAVQLTEQVKQVHQLTA